MPRTRRTRYLFFRVSDRAELDVGALLRGSVRLDIGIGFQAVSILDGSEHPLSRGELDLLLSIPADRYVDVSDGRIDRLARCGLLLIEDGVDELAELRKRDERLAETQWDIYAALYHVMTRWRDVRREPALLGADELVFRETVDDFVARYGEPPSHFHAVEQPLAVRELPVARSDKGLSALLEKRRTSRSFDASRRVTESELAALLYETYGARGYARLSDAFAGLRKSSPSGGGLHPIEAYPLVIDVVGLEPGLYHYGVERHVLELIQSLGQEEAAELAGDFTCGQQWFSAASALVVMTARFERSFWKYRHNEKAFGVILMDAGHLSQTFYLVCAALDLGAFVTAAINSANIDERLGLDGLAEGAIAIVGCGRLATERCHLEPEFQPYAPRETRLE
jgi:putative peptide maturation dehydrogenase